MAKVNPAQTSFNGGEITPLLLAREDLTKYNSSLYVCKNALVLAQGGWTRRGGTVFMTQTKFHDKVSRVFPFQYSIVQNYTLEFGHNYIRFFTDHGILAATTNAITGISKAAQAVLTYSGTDNVANGDRIYVSGVSGMGQVNGREFIVSNLSAANNTVELQTSETVAVSSAAYDAWTSGGTMAKILEVATSYASTDLADIRVVQSADVLYVLHPNFATRILTRVSATSWTITAAAFLDGPYDVTNRTSTTLTSSGTSGNVTITASAVTGINSDTGFQTTDVGRQIRFKSGATWGWATITARTSTTVVTAAVTTAFAATAASTSWRLGIWSGTTGYPRAGTFFEDRLVLGGASTYPQRWDTSNSSDYLNFAATDTSGTVTNSHSIGYTLNSSDVNGIQWIKDNEKGLLIGTSRGEWLAKASSLGEALTPTNVTAKPSTRHGSEAIDPIQAGKIILFVQRAARKLRELTYVFEVDGFKAADMSLLAEHITDPAIAELAYQSQPQSVVWAVRTDGVLLGFTYERDQDVTAWHRHELGGQSDSLGLYVPVVESIACVPHPDGTRDEVYMVVQRYINGQARRYVELMSDTWHDGMAQEDAFHVDCGFTQVTTVATTSVTGLWHLEGQTVGVYVDGTVHPDCTVSNGKITLNYAGYIVTLGYFYESDGVTLPSGSGTPIGSGQANIKRISRVGFWLLDTLGFKYGPSFEKLTEVLERNWGDTMGAATPLFTGVFRGRFEGDYDRLGQVFWRCSGPFPANVLSVIPQTDISEDS